MIVLGGILAFTVVYVTMTVNVVERTTELATLRTAGVPLRRVAGALATESLVRPRSGCPSAWRWAWWRPADSSARSPPTCSIST
jgi:putative ABC transport system permease protein